MTNKVASSSLAFEIQTKRELSSAEHTLTEVRAGRRSMCRKEVYLWDRFQALREEDRALNEDQGRRLYDFGSGKNIAAMKNVLDSIHQLCHKS